MFVALLSIQCGVLLPRTPSTLPTARLNICPSQRAPDFNTNLGRCIDQLRDDYPLLLEKPPAMDIFTDDVELVHVRTGLKLQGRRTYAKLLAFLRKAASLVVDRATIGTRISYDPTDAQIRVRWSARLELKGMANKPWFLDGVGLYSVNGNGDIFRHELRSDVPVGHMKAGQPQPALRLASFGCPWRESARNHIARAGGGGT